MTSATRTIDGVRIIKVASGENCGYYAVDADGDLYVYDYVATYFVLARRLPASLATRVRRACVAQGCTI